jgi:hypothetical protein
MEAERAIVAALFSPLSFSLLVDAEAHLQRD